MCVWDSLHTAQCRQLPSTYCAPLPLSRGDQAVDAEIRKQGEVLEKRTPAMKTSLMVHIVDTEATEAREDSGAGGGGSGGDGAPGSPGAASLLRSPVLDALAELHDARRRATLRDRVAVNARLRVGTLAGSATANVSNAAAGASRVGPAAVPVPSSPTLAAPSPLLTSGAVLPTLPPPMSVGGSALPHAPPLVATDPMPPVALGPQAASHGVSLSTGPSTSPTLGASLEASRTGTVSAGDEVPVCGAEGRSEDGNSLGPAPHSPGPGPPRLQGLEPLATPPGPGGPDGAPTAPAAAAAAVIGDVLASMASPVGLSALGGSASGGAGRLQRQRSEGATDDLGFSLSEEEKRWVDWQQLTAYAE